MLFDIGTGPKSYTSPKPGLDGTSIQEFFRLFPGEEACLRHVFHARFGLEPECPACGKKGKWYRIKGHRRFQHPCGYAIYPLAKTFLHGSTTPLQLWFYAMLHFANSAEGVDIAFLSRHLGVSLKAAFSMASKIRLHLASLEADRQLGAAGRPVTVQLTQFYNVHRSGPVPGRALALVMTEGGKVATVVTGGLRRHDLRKILREWCHPESRFETSSFRTLQISSESGTRRPILHYVSGNVAGSCQEPSPVRSFFNYFQRPLSHHHRRVNYENLWRYIAEAQFRFNRRANSACIFPDMMARFKGLQPTYQEQLNRKFSLIRHPQAGK